MRAILAVWVWSVCGFSNSVLCYLWHDLTRYSALKLRNCGDIVVEKGETLDWHHHRKIHRNRRPIFFRPPSLPPHFPFHLLHFSFQCLGIVLRTWSTWVGRCRGGTRWWTRTTWWSAAMFPLLFRPFRLRAFWIVFGSVLFLWYGKRRRWGRRLFLDVIWCEDRFWNLCGCGGFDSGNSISLYSLLLSKNFAKTAASGGFPIDNVMHHPTCGLESRVSRTHVMSLRRETLLSSQTGHIWRGHSRRESAINASFPKMNLKVR